MAKLLHPGGANVAAAEGAGMKQEPLSLTALACGESRE